MSSYLLDRKTTDEEPLYSMLPGWANGFKFGQVSGVAVDRKGFVVVFHRASREWTGRYLFIVLSN